MSRIDYVTVLMRVPEEDHRWLLEASVDRERHPVTIYDVDIEDKTPQLAIHAPCSEDFQRAIESVGEWIIVGFFVWRQILTDSTDDNYKYVRFGDLLEVYQRYQTHLRETQTASNC